MSHETRNSSGHDADGAPPRVDVLLVTAVKEEYDAVLQVDNGACPGDSWKKARGPLGLEVAFRSFQATHDGQLHVAVTQTLGMGTEATAASVSPLLGAYNPRCLAMCGVCAGRKGEVELGDVIIADTLWNHELGKLQRVVTASGESVTRFLGRNRTYLIHPEWEQLAERFQHPPYTMRVGSIATGSVVNQDPRIFELLAERDYKVLGLEMEASAIGVLARAHKLPYMIVMKGVMDFADAAKNDHLKSAAARASAECLLAFLRAHLPPVSAASAQEAPEPRAREEALAEYKDALAEVSSVRCLDLRGLVGIASGRHQTGLDLLDFAVAPSLHDDTEEEGSRAAILRHQLSSQELTPDKRRELQRELYRLEQGRWDHHGARGTPPFSFARALHHSQRFVIIGDPGAGKSVLTRLALLACLDGDAGYRARMLLAHHEDRYDANVGSSVMALRGLLPVRLTLGALGKALTQHEGSLEECIRQELRRKEAPAALVDTLGVLLTEARLFLILDGLDEVPDRQRGLVVDAITALATRYPGVRILVTSRPYSYSPRIPGFDYRRLAALHDQQQHVLVSRLHHLVETQHQGDAREVERARRRTNALMRAIRTRDGWSEVASNPLLLTLCALTSADMEGLPKHRVFLFENFMRTLLLQWRPNVPREAEGQLLEMWSTVASTLIQQEQRGEVTEGYLLGLLEEALAERKTPATVDAETALRLAVEQGLILKNEETVRFWHSTFAEYLAARAFTVHRKGAAERLLGAEHLPTKVLQFSAARLKYVLAAPGKSEDPELDALFEGLLARDQQGAGRLLRPGLRAVSACIADGVRPGTALVHRVWGTWVELLESTPPSPLWEAFGWLTQHMPRPQLPAPLVERLARMEDHGLEEVRQGIARLVAPAAAEVPAAREACERWLEQSHDDALKLHGAYGLALAGEWSRESVIEALGRFAATKEIPHGEVAEWVRSAPPSAHEHLRTLVRLRLPSEDPSSEEGRSSSYDDSKRTRELKQLDLRLSAACLLAVGGLWDEEVARVLRLTLTGRPSMHREAEAKKVVGFCADAAPVQAALVDWMGDDSTLGSFAREIAKDVAALLEEMPRAILARTVTTEGRTREDLESLLVSIGQERPSFIGTLQRLLAPGEVQRLERSLCAARILLRLAPRDAALLSALRRGVQSPDAMARARWAHLALGFPELSDTALTALQSCARSPDASVRKCVYEDPWNSRWRLEQMPDAGWFACAEDRDVPAGARLDAVKFLAGKSERKTRLVPSVRELLDAEDSKVRQEALKLLYWWNALDVRAAKLAAKEAARTENERDLSLLFRALDLTPEAIQTFLHALPMEFSSTDAEERRSRLRSLASHFAERAEKDPACVELLLDTLEHHGLAGEFAEDVLRFMNFKGHDKGVPVHGAIRERIERAAAAPNQLALRRLVDLGLDQHETRPFAVAASRAIALEGLSRGELAWFARRLGEHALEVSTSMWRLVLDAKSPKLVLEAAANLLLQHGEETHPWIQPAIARVLASPEPLDRLNAARLSLVCHFLEEEARTALIDCLEATGSTHEHDGNVLVALNRRAALSAVYRKGAFILPENEPLMSKLLLREDRIDFIAMHELCSHWPELGLRRLASWLEVDDEQRSIRAVKILATRDGYREAARVALEHRLSSTRGYWLMSFVSLVEELGFFSPEMVEPILVRCEAETSEFDDARQCLVSWLKMRPGIWALLRGLEPARQAAFMYLFGMRVPVTRDAVMFVVEFAFRCSFETPAKSTLERWCEQPSREFDEVLDEEPEEEPEEESGEAQGERADESPTAAAEMVRGWLREALDAQPPPNDLPNIHLFDDLAVLVPMPAQRRIEVLRRALDIDITAIESEYAGSVEPRYHQAFLVLRLLELGYRDERIPSLLATAVYECTWLYSSQIFELASALLELRPVNERLRQFLIKKTINPFGSHSLSEGVDVLRRQLGLSSAELVDVLIARLQSHTLESPTQGPAIFDALEHFGCEPERRAALLLEFVSRCGVELPASTQLELAGRPELSATSAAKLILGVIASFGSYARDASEQWLKRFASQRTIQRNEESMLWHSSSKYLALRLRLLEYLSQVDDPAWLEQVLAELAAAPADTFLALYRRAQEDETSLTNEEWAQLMAWLTLRPDDAKTARLAKEWLSLMLWRSVEPTTVRTLLYS